MQRILAMQDETLEVLRRLQQVKAKYEESLEALLIRAEGRAEGVIGE